MAPQEGSKSVRGRSFPIVEVFGFRYDASSDAAQVSAEIEACPFAGGQCEKQRQYQMGYCSVTYAAEWDRGAPRTYAVCDHRLDGRPVNWAVTDHFGSTTANLVPEVVVSSKPRLSIDYFAYRDDERAEDGADVIAIETQAIDLRGGGVGPAFRAWRDGRPEEWRNYFTAEADTRNRRDTVDFGVNTGNVYKRLGTQVGEKGTFLSQVNVPLYVIAQDAILRQLRSRVPFDSVSDGDPWDICFVGFEYPDDPDTLGQYQLQHSSVYRTTIGEYVRALSQGSSGHLRLDVIARIRKKAAVLEARRNRATPF